MIPHWKQKFALLWTGQALSILSSMISQYALIWYLTDLTGSPAVLSLATMAALGPHGNPCPGSTGNPVPLHRNLCRPLRPALDHDNL